MTAETAFCLASERATILLQGMQVKDFLDLMAIDKKAVDGKLRFILLQGVLGNSIVTGDFDSAVLFSVLEDYCAT